MESHILLLFHPVMQSPLIVNTRVSETAGCEPIWGHVTESEVAKNWQWQENHRGQMLASMWEHS